MSRTVAVAIICKNEEVLIERCLQSVKDADSIWILDTGSQDNTVSICRKYTDNVFLDFVWTDSFCDAQNFLLDKLRGKSDFVLSIDADEFCHDFSEVRKAIELGKDMIRVTMMAEGGNRLEFGFGRLFRNTPEIYWCQPIHKHLNIPGEGEPVGNVKITFGWSPAHNNDPDRSLRMLEKAVADEGEGAVRNLYYLGREYWYKQKYKECTATLGKYVQVSGWPAEKAEAFLIMSQCYSAQGLDEDARDAILQAIKINPNFKEAVQWMASISESENAIQWRRMAKTASNRDVLWDRVPAEPASDVIFLSPHHDDESLFAAFTLIRHKPLVIICTSAYIQSERGDLGCTDEIRTKETIEAMKIAGCPVVFLGIKDTELTEEILRERLKVFKPEMIYAPAIQGGNLQHDLVGKVALELFGNKCERYTTYTKTELYTTGNFEIKPTHNELELKEKMMNCYESQLNLKSTLPHFMAVKGKSEWLV